MDLFVVFVTFLLLLIQFIGHVSSAGQLSDHFRSISSGLRSVRGGADELPQPDRKPTDAEKAILGIGSFHAFRSIDVEKLQNVAHSMTVTECLTAASVADDRGLSKIEASQRLIIYGENKLTEAPQKSIFGLIFEQFQDRLVQILLGVAILSGVLSLLEVSDAKEVSIDALVEPIVIVSILILNAIVGIWQTKSAEDSLVAL